MSRTGRAVTERHRMKSNDQGMKTKVRVDQATSTLADQRGTPQSTPARALASGVTLQHRFDGHFGTVAAVAEVLAEVSCRTTRDQARHDDATTYASLTDLGKIEARSLDRIYNHYAGRNPSNRASDFAESQQAMAASILSIASQEGWLITDSNGLPQVPPRTFGHIDARKVRDWFAQARARNHAEYARALSAALGELQSEVPSSKPGDLTASDVATKPQRPVGDTRPTLTTSEVAMAFSFLPKLQRALGDVNNHRWVLPARVRPGSQPTPAAWCPLELAKVIMLRKGHESDLNRAFLENPVLRQWRPAWQEIRKERNAFGQ